MQKAINEAKQAVKFLHAHPENSYEEYVTTEYILNKCKDLGLQIVDTGIDTGAAALLDVGCDKLVALRADIDAVPTENGPEHLCGHDYHTASLLGAMDYLCRNRDKLVNNVLFIFQPAEECTSGAEYMLDNGLTEYLEEAGVIFGIHNRPEAEVGKIVIHEGYLMAEKSNFILKIAGKSGHGGEPHKCVDPMVAAAQFIMGAQTVVSRNVDPNESAVCSVLSMSCGSSENYVPEEAVLTGSIRSFKPQVHTRMKKRLEELARGIMEAYGCKYEFIWDLHVPAVNNRRELVQIARLSAINVVGLSNIADSEPALGSDDFAVFGRVAPSFYYWVGSGESGGNSAPWHKSNFKVADGYLDIAVRLLLESAMADISQL